MSQSAMPALTAHAPAADLLGSDSRESPINADPAGTRHSSGLLILPAAGTTLPTPMPEATAQLLSQATLLAQSAPADFAYPWVNTRSLAASV